MSVLFADDEGFIRNVANMLLKQLASEVTVVENGQEALDAFNSNGSYTTIILDLSMPVMDGFETCKAIRAAGFTGNILALSADDDEDTQAECDAAGFTALIGKPLKKNAVQQYI